MVAVRTHFCNYHQENISNIPIVKTNKTDNGVNSHQNY